MELCAAWSCRLQLLGAGCLAADQHAFDAQVLVDIGPMHTEGGQLVVRALLRRSVEQTRVPLVWRNFFWSVGLCLDQLCFRSRCVHGLHCFKLLVRNAHAISPRTHPMLANLPLQRAQFMLRHATDSGNAAVVQPELCFSPTFPGVNMGRLAPVGTVEQEDPPLPPQDFRHAASSLPIS